MPCETCCFWFWKQHTVGVNEQGRSIENTAPEDLRKQKKEPEWILRFCTSDIDTNCVIPRRRPKALCIFALPIDSCPKRVKSLSWRWWYLFELIEVVIMAVYCRCKLIYLTITSLRHTNSFLWKINTWRLWQIMPRKYDQVVHHLWTSTKTHIVSKTGDVYTLTSQPYLRRSAFYILHWVLGFRKLQERASSVVL